MYLPPTKWNAAFTKYINSLSNTNYAANVSRNLLYNIQIYSSLFSPWLKDISSGFMLSNSNNPVVSTSSVLWSLIFYAKRRTTNVQI